MFTFRGKTIKQLVCKHQHTRCVHGAEFVSTLREKLPQQAYVVCLDCDLYLYGRPLPEFCFFTKREHNWAYTGKNNKNKE